MTDWDENRIDAIGQNGNEGLHYDALKKQVDGTHYKELAIQPVEYIYHNGLGFLEGNIIKYVTRYKNKNGIADLEKAKHYIEMLIEFESETNE